MLFALALLGGAATMSFTANAPHADNPLLQIMEQGNKDMSMVKTVGDPDVDFVTMMRSHHQTGIKMADYEIENGDAQAMKDMAREIREGQEKELRELDAMLGMLKPNQSEEMFAKDAMKAMEQMMKKSDPKMLDGDADHDFSVLMAEHHRAGIDMAQAAMKLGNEERVKTMAQKMVDMQKQEIEQLETWHKANCKMKQ